MNSLRRSCLLLAAVALSAVAAPAIEEGWHDVVISVNDTDAWVRYWRDTNNYELLYQGEGDARVYDGLSYQVSLLRNPGSERGFVRLVQFDAPAEAIRPNAQTWDVGGWFDFNVRVVDLEEKARTMNFLAWHGYSNPVEFSFGPFVVREWLARGPDGVVIALIERVQPVLEGWPNLVNVSRVFNATVIVSDMQAALSFYRDILGFESYLTHEGASATAGPNVLGLPQNLATEVVRKVEILHPEGTNEGSVELLQFVGADGNDYTARGRPPARGILSLRYSVSTLSPLSQLLSAADVAYERIEGVHLADVGLADLIRVYGPAGEMLEFYAVAD